MGNCIKTKSPIVASVVPVKPVMICAGILFTDGHLGLGGYNKKFISGIGGKKEEKDRDIIDTAFREVIEELLDINPSLGLLDHVRKEMPSSKSIKTTVCTSCEYSFMVYDFADLECFLKIVHSKCSDSPLYTAFPITVSDLIFKRNMERKCEITHLALLPIARNLKLSRDFVNDFNQVCDDYITVEIH